MTYVTEERTAAEGRGDRVAIKQEESAYGTTAGGSRLLKKVGKLLPDYAESHDNKLFFTSIQFHESRQQDAVLPDDSTSQNRILPLYIEQAS
jgi:hypothetical protein